jgi:hypothetical protein
MHVHDYSQRMLAREYLPCGYPLSTPPPGRFHWGRRPDRKGAVFYFALDGELILLANQGVLCEIPWGKTDRTV